ncbi:uncharacterized protein LOC124430862 isoform X1 [Vespa crabro]|uniref:uncharacterized protein LOC124430862 isoform X1 n=3 Tax=Vespa crabro TaxID=7445 RepID=UPI001F021A2E|nr:uncharacterized protein LOC124430862 isoform X1 [Vespa crabro]
MAQSANIHLDLEGIIQKDKSNEYFCCICNEIISEKNLMLKHVNTRSHIKAFRIFIKYFQVAKSVTIKCKICQGTGSWKLVRRHVEMHKLTPWYEPKDKYKWYFDNFLIIHKNQLYCSLCTVIHEPFTWNDAFVHMNNEWHTTFMSSVNNVNDEFLKNPKILNKYESFVSNSLVYLETKLFYCFICETKISGDIKNLNEHIKGDYHNRQKLTFNIKNIIPLKKTVPIKNCIFEIPKDLHWIIQVDNIYVFTDSLYCNICNVTMNNVGSINSHLRRHVRLRDIFEKQDKTPVNKIEIASSKAIVHFTSISNYSNRNLSNDIQCNLLLNIPDHLKWMIEALNVEIFFDKLYCTLCKVYMANDTQVKSHLTTHFKEYSKKKKNQNSEFSWSIASNETKIVNKLKNCTLQDNKSSFDTECIFSTAKEIKSSVYLSIFKENNIYCLVCQKDIFNNFQVYYDHIFSKEHLIHLINIDNKKVRKEFITFDVVSGDIKNGIDEFLTCILCNTKIRNINELLYEHIELEDHASYYREWKKACLKFYNDILTFIKCNWYYTTKYYCDICSIEFSSEICFAKHMNEKEIHFNSGNANYHSCVPCSLLWYTYNLSYSNHSKTPKHQYMISCGTYVANKFPSEVERFLMSFEENTEELLKFSLITEKAKENKILTCLKTDTISAFNKVEAYAYGSRICGSGLPDSDINIFLDCLNTYNGKDVCSKQLEATVKTINSILLSKPSVWHVNEIILDDGRTIMKVWYIPMQLHCTISFKNGLDVESTNLIKHFNETYLPCRKLILILKKWLSFCGISGFPCISNYALTWCIIFYLQIMFILPSITELIQENNKSKLIDGWQTGVSYEFSARKTSKFPFVKLLSGFFIFYAEFDYRRHIICPLLGKPIERKIFTDLSLLPNDMAPYVQYVRNAKNPKLFCLSPMCVQDPFNLSDNLTVMVEKSTLNNFRIFCSKSAEILIDLF